MQILLCPGPHFGGAAAARFAHSASSRVRRHPTPHVVLDLSHVATVDVAGLLSVSALGRSCRAAGGSLRLCNPTGEVRRLLAATGLHRLADIYHTRRHATLV